MEFDDFGMFEEEFEDDFDFLEEDDYASNSPCDFTGYCAGMSCKHYWTCHS